MSRRSPGLTVCLLVAAAAAPSSASGQSDAELRARLDSLRPLVEQARAAADAAHAAADAQRALEAAPATDTIAVGPLRVIAREGQAERASELFGEVWEHEYAPFVETPALASEQYFTFAWPAADTQIRVSGVERRVELRPWRSRAAVKRVIRRQIAGMLGTEISGTPIGTWISGEVRAPADPGALYRMIVGASAASTRACLEGESLRCWDALAADLTDDPFPLDDWYSPEERRDLVAFRFPLRFQRAGSDPRLESCIERRVYSDCDELLKERSLAWGAGMPIDLVGPRAHLTWVALNAGGSGAWARLVADPDATPGDALRAASGLDTRALSELWREDVVGARSPPLRILDPRLLLTFAWMGIFTAFAARSTRWRLG